MLSSVCYLVTLYFLPLINSVEWIEHRGLWYYISDGETVDHREATQICDSMNAHLAVITNDDQNDFIKNETSNNTERWIGLSTDSSHHNDNQCDNNIWFWNSDWNCTNSFEPTGSDIYATLPVTFTPIECAGVTAFSGIWAMQDCSLKFGYICQWECKRFYLNLIDYDKGKLNGIYYFDSYYNGNARYIKAGTNRTRRIYKSKNEWILHNEDESSTQRARFETESYVPYGNDLSWKTFYNVVIDSSSWCVECEELLMCIPNTTGNMPNCNFMTLNVTSPDYSNSHDTVFIKHLHNSDSCICRPTKDECGQRCGYIFPYPEVITRTTLNNGETVVFTNMCVIPENTVTTSEISGVVTSMQGQIENSLPDSNNLNTVAISVDDKQSETKTSTSNIFTNTNQPNAGNIRDSSQLINIAAPLVSVVVVIIIVVVAVIVILLRKRGLCNKKSQSNSQSVRNSKTHVGRTNSNVYIDSDDHLQVNTLEHTYAEPAGYGSSHNQYEAEDHYTYVDATNKNIISNSIKNCKEIVPSEIYAKEKPIDGYLAPDYGILMDNITKQDTLKPKQPTLAPPIYTEVKKPNPNKQGSEQDKTNDGKLPMNRSEINDSGNGNTYDTHSIHDEDNSNLHDYYNFEKKVDDDDDLELFENTVYNET